MSGVNAWGRLNTPAKQSQFSLDRFEEWKAQQNDAIAQRGVDSDPAVEEEHNRHMLRQNLNAYVCYKELDRYTACLEEKKLIHHRGDAGVSSVAASFEINTHNKVNEKMCRSTHTAYVACMSSQASQEAVLQSATLEPHCSGIRTALFDCMRDNHAVEAQTNTPQCADTYRGLLRCGLNHLWNHYWREVNRFSDTDEYHLYELSRDDGKRQAYLRTITSTAAQQQADRKEGREMVDGYYLHSADSGEPDTH
ncbi:hypothetical protein NESM_000308000 [Novymonas esmeraldas]|uniref:Uncharacterized protein n=1 Tax=Novymonas esmeraldas TaxID=1808958 RepID=A0AAW0EKY2_9TRYP